MGFSDLSFVSCSLTLFAEIVLDQEQLLRPGDFGIDQKLLRDIRLGDVGRDLARVTLTMEDDLLPRLLL